LSTLHTNDTLSAPPRLLDMGAKGYLLASVLRVILAQRLVRRICHKCICDDPLNDAEKIWVKGIDPALLKNTVFKHGTGCSHCNNTGYRGRIGVFELLPISGELMEALRRSDIGEFNKLAAKQPLYTPLLRSALNLAAEGATTVKEVIHMAGEV